MSLSLDTGSGWSGNQEFCPQLPVSADLTAAQATGMGEGGLHPQGISKVGTWRPHRGASERGWGRQDEVSAHHVPAGSEPSQLIPELFCEVGANFPIARPVINRCLLCAWHCLRCRGYSGECDRQ